MKKICLSLFTLFLFSLGFVNTVHADEYLRIGMEAAYAPFNWTQDDDKNGAVKIEGTNQYANGYDVQIATILVSQCYLSKKIVPTPMPKP